MKSKEDAISMINHAFSESVTISGAHRRVLEAVEHIYGDCIAPPVNNNQEKVDGVDEIRN